MCEDCVGTWASLQSCLCSTAQGHGHVTLRQFAESSTCLSAPWHSLLSPSLGHTVGRRLTTPRSSPLPRDHWEGLARCCAASVHCFLSWPVTELVDCPHGPWSGAGNTQMPEPEAQTELKSEKRLWPRGGECWLGAGRQAWESALPRTGGIAVAPQSTP